MDFLARFIQSNNPDVYIIQTRDHACHTIAKRNVTEFERLQNESGYEAALNYLITNNLIIRTLGFPSDVEGFWGKVPPDYKIN